MMADGRCCWSVDLCVIDESKITPKFRACSEGANWASLMQMNLVFLTCTLKQKRTDKFWVMHPTFILIRFVGRQQCTSQSLKGFFRRVIPILDWLPAYDIKRDLMGDCAAGLTVGIMRLPQGESWPRPLKFTFIFK